MLTEARALASVLVKIRLSDIAPRDLEAEEHAKQHLQDDDPEFENEELAEQQKMEKLEDMLAQLTATTEDGQSDVQRPTLAEYEAVKLRLLGLCGQLKISVNWS